MSPETSGRESGIPPSSEAGPKRPGAKREERKVERLTVPVLVRRWGQAQPDKAFVVTDDDTLSYGQLERETAASAYRFATAGVSKGTRVGILMPNGTAWPVVAIGASRAGATVVPLSTLLRPPELAAHLRAAGVEHLVLVPTFRDRDYVADLASISPRLVPATGLFVEALPRLRSITLWDAARRRQGDEPFRAELVESLDAAVRPADDLVVIFTSGSRGQPKGVIHTHGGALGATAAGLDARRLGPDGRLYIPMPFFWVGGFGTGLLSALIAGATLLTEHRPQQERTLPNFLGMTDVEVRVVDVETGVPVGAGVAGEIQLRGPNLMRGICGRTRRETFTEDGFYQTGDLGRLDAEGYLHLDLDESAAHRAADG
ncbi:MAG: AMP-binding protein [Acidimicrobiia bacterium]